jgi:hypothetical protein
LGEDGDEPIQNSTTVTAEDVMTRSTTEPEADRIAEAAARVIGVIDVCNYLHDRAEDDDSATPKSVIDHTRADAESGANT